MSNFQKTILVTGGAGFIGSNFARFLYENYPDYRIIILDALTYAGAVDNLPVSLNKKTDGRIVFWYGNVCNAELVDTLVSESDMVFHFAAESHVTRSIYDNLLFYQTDVLGTHTVANAVLKYKSRIKLFVHISSSEVYGTADAPKMDEEHPLKPLSPYASAKCGADRLVYSYVTTYDIPAVIVRPFNNYGPYQHLEKVVPRFISSVLLDEPLTVHGNGAAERDFIHVHDHCRALELIMKADINKIKGEVFNIGSEESRSVLQIAQDVLRLMDGNESQIQFVGERPAQVFRHTGDASKIRKILGWKPAMTWEDGLSQTIEWYRGNESWWTKQMWMRHIPIITASGKREMH